MPPARRDGFNLDAGRLVAFLPVIFRAILAPCSASRLPLYPTFTQPWCRSPYINGRKLGRYLGPRKLATVRDRWGKGSAPACEGSDRRLHCGDDGVEAGGVRNLRETAGRAGARQVPQVESVGSAIPFWCHPCDLG